MKMQLVTATLLMKIEAKIPRSCGPPPLPKGAIGGFLGVALITAAHFHALCCTDWYVNYFARVTPVSDLVGSAMLGVIVSKQPVTLNLLLQSLQSAQDQFAPELLFLFR
jgi:hypothetical protein